MTHHGNVKHQASHQRAVLLRLPRQAKLGLQAAEIRLLPLQVKVAAQVAAVAHQRERHSLLPVALVVRRLC